MNDHRMTNDEIKAAYEKAGGEPIQHERGDAGMTGTEFWQMLATGAGLFVCIVVVVMALQAHPELWDALKQLLGG